MHLSIKNNSTGQLKSVTVQLGNLQKLLVEEGTAGKSWTQSGRLIYRKLQESLLVQFVQQLNMNEHKRHALTF